MLLSGILFIVVCENINYYKSIVVSYFMGNYEVIASAGPYSDELKSRVSEDEPRTLVIYDNSELYAVRFSEMRNIGLDNYDAVFEESTRRGLANPAFFNRACIYCGHSRNNLFDIMASRVAEGDDGMVVMGSVPDDSGNCNYAPDKHIVLAREFHGMNSPYFYAVDDVFNCAFDDALVSVLYQRRLLDPYFVDMDPADFDLRPLSSFEGGQDIPVQYHSRTIEKILDGKGFSAPNRKSLLMRLLTMDFR